MHGLVLMAFLGLGCGDKGHDDDGDGTSADDGGSGGSTDGSAICGRWSGITGVGTTWEYRFSDAGVEGTFVTTVTSLDSATGDVTMDSDYVGSASGYDYTSSTTSDLRCDDDGMWMLGSSTTYEITTGGTTSSGWSRIDYDEPVLLLPRDVAVGDAWVVDASGTIEASTTDPMTFSTTTRYAIAAEETVTVEAGTFDTIRLEATVKDSSGPSSTASTWIARDVGTVKTDTSELLSYDQP